MNETQTIAQVYMDYLQDQAEYPTGESFFTYLIGLVDDGVIENKITFKDIEQ